MIAAQPFANTRFRVEVDALRSTGALEVIFPEARIISGPSRTKAGAARKTSTSIAVQYGNLIIRRGVTRSSEWYDWWHEVRTKGPRSRRNVGITLLDETGGAVHRWLFTDTMPIAYRVSDLNALGNGILTETLELAVGGFSVGKAK